VDRTKGTPDGQLTAIFVPVDGRKILEIALLFLWFFDHRRTQI